MIESVDWNDAKKIVKEEKIKKLEVWPLKGYESKSSDQHDCNDLKRDFSVAQSPDLRNEKYDC